MTCFNRSQSCQAKTIPAACAVTYPGVVTIIKKARLRLITQIHRSSDLSGQWLAHISERHSQTGPERSRRHCGQRPQSLECICRPSPHLSHLFEASNPVTELARYVTADLKLWENAYCRLHLSSDINVLCSERMATILSSSGNLRVPSFFTGQAEHSCQFLLTATLIFPH
jgi:hypothetical protein